MRPGGLTALAVINFVFAFWNLLGGIAQIALFFMIFVGGVDTGDPKSGAQFDKVREIGASTYIVIIVALFLSATMLAISGVGYLKLKRVWGRYFASVWAVAYLGFVVFMIIQIPREMDGGFSMGALAGMLYPSLTLILVNTIFRRDFSR